MHTRFATVLVALLSAFSLPAQTNGDVTVRLNTSLGDIDLILFPETAPVTVENFLNYVRRGAYDNSFIHRSVPGFVIQGGGYTFAGNTLRAIPIDPPIRNEFRTSNTRGTIAMAKLGNNPNSATSQWFFNLADNSQNLDNQNGGFTVFGRVIGGLGVMDQIATVPIYRLNAGDFATIPLLNYQTGQTVSDANLVLVRSVSILNGPPSTFNTPPATTRGREITRTFQFSDPNGADDLGVVNILINRALDGNRACYLAYDASANVLVLQNDPGTDGSVLLLPSASTLSNSQCSINAAGVTAVKAGSTLSLTIPFTFTESFGGSHVVYAAARDRNSGNSGWSPVGAHVVSTLATNPLPLGADLTSTVVRAGVTTPIAVQYRDATASTNLQPVQLLINSALDGANACYFGFDHSGNYVYLVGDDGVLQPTPVRLNGVAGGASFIQNSQCILFAEGSIFNDSGTTLSLVLQVQFKSGFGGRRLLFGGAQTTGGANSGWHVLGGLRVE
jgi:cyclophilin family peptidyl-prolyl cis-trans isomerase